MIRSMITIFKLSCNTLLRYALEIPLSIESMISGYERIACDDTISVHDFFVHEFLVQTYSFI